MLSLQFSCCAHIVDLIMPFPAATNSPQNHAISETDSGYRTRDLEKGHRQISMREFQEIG